jgi:energy-coupling factor transporter ATP-binding protein EcfA2
MFDIKSSNSLYDNTNNHRGKSIGFGFDIRDYIDHLEPTKKKGKFICPGCGGNNLSINPRNGAYQCFNGCENKDIREAIAPRRNRDEFKPDEFDRKIAQKRLDNERKRERELKLKTEKLSKSLNPIERDTEHRKILSQLTLSDEHKDYLVNRLGFPLEALERCRTVEPKQSLTVAIDKRLAGVNPFSGMALTNGEKGILVAFPDADGYLVAMKLYNPTGDPKSKWFSSDWFDIGTSPKFSNEEPPIAVYYPETIRDLTKIGLCEGVEWKAQEAANRLGYPVIGFSGISFLNLSPETTKSAIATIQAKTGINNDVELIPIPDGGLVQNSANIKIVQDFIKNATHKCAVAWWGQVDKSQNDIDEINQGKIDSIQYLMPDEFFDVVNIEQWKKKIEEKQHKLNTLSYKADILINQPKFPTLTELQQIKPLLTEGILTILGATGSGKSTLIKALKQLWLDQGKDIISIVPRIALGREQAHQLDIIWIGDMGAEKVSIDLMAENTRQMGLCFNSLKRLRNKDFSKAVILFDESELTCSDLVTARTIKDERSLILSILETKLKKALNGNGLIVLSDAHLTDVSVDYFKTLCPDTPIFTIINEAKPERWEIDFYTGKTPDAVLQEMYEDINNNLRVILAVDNQEKAEAYHRDLAKKYPDKIIDRVDRTFTETQEGKDYVENLNKSILNRKPDILIYTGSMGTGCSIDGKHYDKELDKILYFPEVYDHFDKVYGLFFGVVPSNQIRQYLARYRKPVPRVIWCAEFGYADESLKSFDPDVIKRTIFKNKKMSSEIIDFAVSLAKESLPDNSSPIDFHKALGELIGQDGTWDNPHMDLFSKIKARNNYNLSQLAIQLRQELIDDGHNLVDYCSGSGNNLTDEIKDEQEEIRREKATAIATATDITLEQAKVIKRKFTTSEGERNQVDKAFLKAELPNIDLTPDFVFDWVISDHRKALNQTKLFFYVQNPDVAKYLDNREWIARLRQSADGVALLPDIKTYAPMVTVVKDMGYFDLIDINNPDREYRETDTDVIEFMKRAYFMRYKIHPALGLTIKDKTHPAKFIKGIGRKLGLDFTEKQKRDGEKRYRTFKLNAEILNDPTRLEILESLSCKFAEILTLSSVESVTDHDFIFNKKGQSVTELYPPVMHNSHDFPLVESHQVAPPNNEIDPFADYQVGDRVLLWHPFNGQWQPATIQRVVSGFNGFIHALGDNGLGDSITRHKLSQLAPMGAVA